MQYNDGWIQGSQRSPGSELYACKISARLAGFSGESAANSLELWGRFWFLMGSVVKMDESVSTIKPCRACKQPIDFDASVCHLCQKDQSKSVGLINRIAGLVGLVGVALTLIGTYYSVKSASEAQNERRQAETALNAVIEIEDRLQSLHQEVLYGVETTIKSHILNATNNNAIHECRLIRDIFTCEKEIIDALNSIDIVIAVSSGREHQFMSEETGLAVCGTHMNILASNISRLKELIDVDEKENGALFFLVDFEGVEKKFNATSEKCGLLNERLATK